MDDLLKNVSKDRSFYFLISGFMLVAFLAALALGDLKWFIPGVYFFRWTRVVPVVLSVIVVYFAIRSLASPTPIEHLLGKLKAFFRDRAAGLVLFSCIAIFHGTFTSLKSMLPELHPFAFDPAIADLDELLHAGPAWMQVRFLDSLTGVIQFLYGTTWFMLVTGFTFAMCVANPSRLRSQYIWTFLLCWTVLGIVIAGCFMSAGPVFYDRLLDEDRFVGLTAHLTSTMAEKGVPLNYPELLWTAYATKTAGLGTGISAFPSLHLAMSTLFFLAAHRFNRVLGRVMLGYLVMTMLGSVHLGWHYAVDGYFSIIATTAIWKMVGVRLKIAEQQTNGPSGAWAPATGR